MRTVCIALVFSLICFGQCKESDPLTQTQRAWVNEFVSLGITVNGSDPQLSDADLVPFDYLSDAKIVGLGEGSHGAHEFFQMKHRIFKYLVERYSFRAFAFEMDFAEAMIFDDYIQGKTGGDLKALMVSKMIFWTWKHRRYLNCSSGCDSTTSANLNHRKFTCLALIANSLLTMPIFLCNAFRRLIPGLRLTRPKNW